MGVWKQVAQNVGGLAKHVGKAVLTEPLEVAKEMVGANSGDNQGSMLEQGQQTQPFDPAQGKQNTNQSDDLAKAGFKTKNDFNKYQQLSGNRDQMELAILRKRLHQEQGIETDIERGMAKARQEYEQKEEERKKVEEKEEEQKKEFEFMKKQEENAQVKAAKNQSNAENKSWGAG